MSAEPWTEELKVWVLPGCIAVGKVREETGRVREETGRLCEASGEHGEESGDSAKRVETRRREWRLGEESGDSAKCL